MLIEHVTSGMLSKALGAEAPIIPGMKERAGRSDLRRPARRRSRSARADTINAEPATGGFQPLSADDGLVFRVVIGAGDPHSPLAPPPDPRSERAAAAFREGLGAVWRALAEDERSLLLNHWWAEDVDPTYWPWPQGPRPLMQVVEDRYCRADGDDAAWGPTRYFLVGSFGRALAIPVSAVLGAPLALRHLIGRALFRAGRWASGQHLAQVRTMITAPLARLKREAGGLTGPARARAVAALEQQLADAIAAEEVAAMERWGLAAATRPLIGGPGPDRPVAATPPVGRSRNRVARRADAPAARPAVSGWAAAATGDPPSTDAP